MALGNGCDQAHATARRLTTSRTDAATSRSMTVYCRSMTVIVLTPKAFLHLLRAMLAV